MCFPYTGNEPNHRYYLSEQLVHLTRHIGLQDIFSDGLSEKSQQQRTSALQDGFSGTDASSDGNPSSGQVTEVEQLQLTREKVEALKRLNEEGSVRYDERSGVDILEQAATQVSVVDTYDLYVSAVW